MRLDKCANKKSHSLSVLISNPVNQPTPQSPDSIPERNEYLFVRRAPAELEHHSSRLLVIIETSLTRSLLFVATILLRRAQSPRAEAKGWRLRSKATGAGVL